MIEGFTPMSKLSFIFKPFRLLLLFLTSPWLWVVLGALSAVTAIWTLCLRHPVKYWMIKQATVEVAATVGFLMLAIVHHYYLRDFVRQTRQRLKAWFQKWWRKRRSNLM